MDLLVIGSIEDIAASVFGIYKVTPSSGHGIKWQNLQKFITNSYMIGKICFKLHSSPNVLIYATKLLPIFSSSQIVLQVLICWSWGVSPYISVIEFDIVNPLMNTFDHTRLLLFRIPLAMYIYVGEV